MQLIIRQARQDLGDHPWHPEEMAAYIQASALLQVACELKELRQLLASGEGGLIVGIDNAK